MSSETGFKNVVDQKQKPRKLMSKSVVWDELERSKRT